MEIQLQDPRSKFIRAWDFILTFMASIVLRITSKHNRRMHGLLLSLGYQELQRQVGEILEPKDNTASPGGGYL